MEVLAGLFFLLFFFYILFFVVRTAVRDGILAARQAEAEHDADRG